MRLNRISVLGIVITLFLKIKKGNPTIKGRTCKIILRTLAENKALKNVLPNCYNKIHSIFSDDHKIIRFN